MPFVSLEHTTNGMNFQRNWHSEDAWRDAIDKDATVIWSHLFKTRTGELVCSLWN